MANRSSYTSTMAISSNRIFPSSKFHLAQHPGRPKFLAFPTPKPFKKLTIDAQPGKLTISVKAAADAQPEPSAIGYLLPDQVKGIKAICRAFTSDSSYDCEENMDGDVADASAAAIIPTKKPEEFGDALKALEAAIMDRKPLLFGSWDLAFDLDFMILYLEHDILEEKKNPLKVFGALKDVAIALTPGTPILMKFWSLFSPFIFHSGKQMLLTFLKQLQKMKKMGLVGKLSRDQMVLVFTFSNLVAALVNVMEKLTPSWKTDLAGNPAAYPAKLVKLAELIPMLYADEQLNKMMTAHVDKASHDQMMLKFAIFIMHCNTVEVDNVTPAAEKVVEQMMEFHDVSIMYCNMVEEDKVTQAAKILAENQETITAAAVVGDTGVDNIGEAEMMDTLVEDQVGSEPETTTLLDGDMGVNNTGGMIL